VEGKRFLPYAKRASLERGDVALDAIWGLLLGSLVLLSCAFLTSRVSSVAAFITHEINGRLAAAKTISVVSAALFALDRNRQPFAAQITSGSTLRFSNGVRHPLSSISTTSGPRTGSDIITVIDLDNRYRGAVTAATISGTTIDATVCGLSSRIPSGAFKSYLILTIEGPRQVVGEVLPISPTCARLMGTSIQGTISGESAIPSRPLVFVPIDREYSIFVDRAANLRLTSHTGNILLENQPISRNVDSITIAADRRANGLLSFKLTVRPTSGREISHVIIPALSPRGIWNEVLP
jgi:hypothetical protein